MRPKSTIRSCE